MNLPPRRRDAEFTQPEGAEEAELTARYPASRIDRVTDLIIGGAIEVHRHLGAGLMESTYEECLSYELRQRGLALRRQVFLPILYKGVKLDAGYKLDVLVEDLVVVELKTVEQLLPVHTAQLLTYLKLSGKQVGLLINFNVEVLKKGLRRVVNRFRESRDEAVSSASSAPSGFQKLGASASRR